MVQAFSLTTKFLLAMVFAVIAGFGTMAQFTICNIVVQSETATHIRGRVISILIMAIVGIIPLGSIVVGAVSQQIGAPATVLCEGVTALVIALVFFKTLTRRSASPAPESFNNNEEEELSTIQPN